MRFSILILFLLLSISNGLSSQTIPIASQKEVLEMVERRPDSGYIVINFWATWCGPCLDEIPYFQRADTTLRGENFQFVFVSLGPINKNKAISKFVKKMNMPGQHYHMNTENINTFIETVDSSWQGAIPYTLIISPNGKKGHEGAFFSYKDLWNFIRFD